MSWWRSSRRRPGATAVAHVKSVTYATSPLLASKTPPWRSRFLVVLIGAAFCLLLGRAAYIQIIGTDFYQNEGDKRYARTLELPASRGRILDRQGQMLATSVAVPSIWAIPKDFEATPEQRNQIASLLGITPSDLERKLSENIHFVWLRRLADESVWQGIKALGVKGIYEQHEYRRQYPEGESAAHIVGFTNIEANGQEGIELAFQKDLLGRDGERGVVKDRLGRVVEDRGERVDPVNGRDITLSIDSKLQFFAYQRVRDAVTDNKARAGSVVVLDAITGEVLALANYPSFNPGDRSHLTGEQLRNRALTDTFEPGSTMKPLVASLALQRGNVRPDTVIDTQPFKMTGLLVKDAHPHNALTVAQVIQKSSNVGAVKLAMGLESRDLWETFSAVGLGQKPQLSFPGVVTGRLRPYKSWRPVEKATMSYGYGLSASLFQLARAYTVFARDGEVIPATLLKQPDGTVATGVRVFDPQVAKTMRGMLQMAAGEGGTGPKARTQGYSVGGKSGTAHKQVGKGYAADRYRSWFVGIAPISNPRIVVAVMVDDPRNGLHFGGDVAAPVFSQVVQQTLRLMGVPPDQDMKPQILAAPAVAEEESF